MRIYQALPFLDTPRKSDPLYLSWNLPWLTFWALSTITWSIGVELFILVKFVNILSRFLYYFGEKYFSMEGSSNFGIRARFRLNIYLRSTMLRTALKYGKLSSSCWLAIIYCKLLSNSNSSLLYIFCTYRDLNSWSFWNESPWPIST